MMPGRIPNATRRLGAPADWDKGKQGACVGLAIRDDTTTAGPGMTSVWHPTPEELERLKAGAGVYLTVLGMVHPPISMSVGSAPDERRGPPRPSAPPSHHPVG